MGNRKLKPGKVVVKPPVSQRLKVLISKVADHQSMVDHYRANVIRVLNDIEKGQVDPLDLARLRNFCQMSLVIIAKHGREEVNAAFQQAEIASFLHDTVNPGYGVVLDPSKQNPEQNK